MVMRKIHRWLSLVDFKDAITSAIDQIIARYARGNTSVQNGWYIDEDDLKALSAKGDDAMKKLRKRIPAT